MTKRSLLTAVALAGLLAQPASAQNARTIVGNASKAMGAEMLNSIWYYGSGAHLSLGQNSNANAPWPRVNANDYPRAIDFTQPASRATWLTLVRPVNGGATVQENGQQNITPAATSWAQQLQLWVTPWGFLKGTAANNGTARARTIDGRPYHVVTRPAPQKSPSGQPYRRVGDIDSQNLVARVQTWLEHPILGDMLVETEYTHYRDNNGLKFPAQIVQRRGGWPVFEAFILGARTNPANIKELLTAPVAPADRDGGVPAATAPKSEKLADGVYRTIGVYNALAVEFRDHILLFEPGPQNEGRAQAIIAEAKRVIPNKPIRMASSRTITSTTPAAPRGLPRRHGCARGRRVRRDLEQRVAGRLRPACGWPAHGARSVARHAGNRGGRPERRDRSGRTLVARAT